MSSKERALEELQRKLLEKYGPDTLETIQQEVDDLRSKEKLTGADLDAVEQNVRKRTGRVSKSLGKLRRFVPDLKVKGLKNDGDTHSKLRLSSNSPDKPILKRPSSLTKSSEKPIFANTSRPFTMRNSLRFSRLSEDRWGLVLQRDAMLHKAEKDLEAQNKVAQRKSYGAFLHKQALEKIEKAASAANSEKQQDKEYLLRVTDQFQKSKDTELLSKFNDKLRWQAAMNESIQKSKEKALQQQLIKRLEREEAIQKAAEYEEERKRTKTVLREKAREISNERASKIKERKEMKKLESLNDKNESLKLIKLFDKQVEAQEEQRRQEEALRATRAKSIQKTTLITNQRFEDLVKQGETRAEIERQKQEAEYQRRFFAKSQREQEAHQDRLLTLQKQVFEKKSRDRQFSEVQKEQGEIWKSQDEAYIEATRQAAEKDLEKRREVKEFVRTQISQKARKKWDEMDFSPHERKMNRQFFMTLGLT